ncbi:hypothetical protein [Parabacteroides sp.]
MRQRTTCLAFMLAVVLAGCTEETVRKDGGDEPQPGGDGSAQRREVQLTLNNELVLKHAATKADDAPIATVEENAIASLDVYVFGSETEEGEYTFQERFAYRADDEALPAGATLLDLTATDGTQKQTKGLLRLKKGLFVKLYCVANNTALVNPATGKLLKDDDFVPLTFSAPGEAGTGVATEGTPKEAEFITFHTPLLDAGQVADILLTPLAMSGSYTIPVDLTDFETSARIQLGFKLTRLAARFDIVNNAEESRFTIKEVSMGKGRCGATFFPIRIYGDAPQAKEGELITYPVRAFTGDNANIGTQTGAFYSYPSPISDNGFLILRGLYQVNKTEVKEVSYQIPFTQYAADGSATAIEINNNHRYTIGITKADNYHLDFTLTVADWTDSGYIDDYTPGEDGKAAVTVEIPDGYKDETTYNENTRTIAMSVKDGSNLNLIVRSSAPLSFQSTYAGGLASKEYDWLNIEEVLIKAALSEYNYHLILTDGYDKKRYPKAVLRFMNLTDGTETVVFVDALAAPSLNETTQPAGSFNSFDPVAAKASLYKTTGSNVKIQLTCPDGVTLKSKPDWLDADEPLVSGTESTYTFTLNDRSTTDTQGEVLFCSAKNEDWTTAVAVELKDASIIPTFANVGGSTGNTYTEASGNTPTNVDMSIVQDNVLKVNTTTLAGVAVSIAYESGGPAWLTCAGASDEKVMSTQQVKAVTPTSKNELEFKLNTDVFATQTPTKATVTLKNRSGGPDYTFTITPEFVAPKLTTAATMTLSAGQNTNVPSITIQGSCLGGNTLDGPEWITYDKKETTDKTFSYTLSLKPDIANFPTSVPSTQTIQIKNRLNTDKVTEVKVNFTEANAWIASTLSGYDEISGTEYRVNNNALKTLSISYYTMFLKPTVTPTYDGTYCDSGSKNWLTVSEPEVRVENNRRKCTYTITVSKASGTDVDYQLHKGAITIKYNTTQLANYTIWRGASRFGYPAGGGSPYYTAIKKDGYWWAPVNCGATRIATSGTDGNGIGHLYQWGREDYTDFGGTTKAGPISMSQRQDHVFYTAVKDWLSSTDNTLWQNGKNDPCPDGYRMPTIDELNTLSTETSIRLVNGLVSLTADNGFPAIVLPAAGRRDENGDADSRGTWGIYVSTSINTDNNNGRRLEFKDNENIKLGATYRVYANSIRCIKKTN